MLCLVRAFGKTTRSARFALPDNVTHQQYRCKKRRVQAQLSNLIKVYVVGSGSLGDPASLLVKTCDSFMHLFNCGEGTFRLMYERGRKFSNLSNIYCTSNRWDRVGGIPSVARAVFDRNQSFPTFHGPPQIEQVLPTFACLTDLNPEQAVTEHQYNPESCVVDAHVQVDSIKLESTDTTNSRNETVVAYVCRLRARRGSVSVTKLRKNKIPEKHLWALTGGKDVTLDDGTIIYAKDYSSPGFAGGNFLSKLPPVNYAKFVFKCRISNFRNISVIDVPSRDYLLDLDRNELLNAHIDEIKSSLGMEFVAHFASPTIVETPEYQTFMRRLNAKRHLALNESNMYGGLRDSHLMQHTLNQLDANIYPHLCSKVLKSQRTFTSLDTANENPNTSANLPICIEPTSAGTRYIFTVDGKISERVFSRSSADDDDDEDTDSSNDDCETGDETEVHKTTARENAFPKIVFFGTGSSFSSVTKTVTAILVHTSSESSILLDCGEGTVGQMCRFYGSRTENVIRNIKALHVTHMHGDHHMGIMNLVRIRQKFMPDNRPKLLLMAPREPFESLLDFYETHFGNVRDEFILLDNEDLINGLPADLRSIINVTHLQTCRVPHTDLSYAISLKLNVLPEQNEEFKLTFSGDTIPCDSLVELGKNSTLLIHEATHEDILAPRAASVMHSTVSQAIEQSEKMQAKYTVLTHFSQRYHVLPPISDHLMKNKNIGIALDFMEIVPDDLSKLNGLYFKLKESYAGELRRVEQRSKIYAVKYKDSYDMMD